MASWIYTISEKLDKKNGIFTLINDEIVTACVENFKKHVKNRTLKENVDWGFSKNFNEVKVGDVFYINGGGCGLIGYAVIQEINNDKKDKRVNLLIDIEKSIDFIDSETKFSELRKHMKSQTEILSQNVVPVYDSIKEVEENINEISRLNKQLEQVDDETEREQIIKARIGQGRFRKDLIKIDKCCKISGLSLEYLLIASHIKDWSKCKNNEKSNPANGLLLANQYDALFDKKLITFEDDGSIILSKDIDEKIKQVCNVDENIKISLRKENIPYMKWHRKEFYKLEKSR